MEGLFASGRIVDLILVLVVAETLGLVWLRRVLGRGPSLPALLPSLLAGVGLMLALRAALLGSAWTSIAPWLALSLLAHLADLALRFARETVRRRQQYCSPGTSVENTAFPPGRSI
ncbi:hypothetical protein [Methylobacterium organophilum]|uniref:DUF1622 domain-containing protein n=1 Tax=Methylobacterium organophilum TaxID=410 RepID=A0ABQ4TBZ4_METOR|nr:hypothetical protein [Methylobacterium organophilum]GJE28571.1 hypothetical protein LKMONMHP_3443 [Methylobacterium organophilum]